MKNYFSSKSKAGLKPAFTMIELIFVIVLLGILAAVAIPKFAATRDDALAVTGLQNIVRAVSSMRVHYNSQGSRADFSDMVSSTQGWTDTNISDDVVTWRDCISVSMSTDGNISLIKVTNPTEECSMIQTRIEQTYDYNVSIFGVNHVKY